MAEKSINELNELDDKDGIMLQFVKVISVRAQVIAGIHYIMKVEVISKVSFLYFNFLTH